MPKPSVSKCRPVFLTAMKGRYEAVKEPDQSLLNLLLQVNRRRKCSDNLRMCDDEQEERARAGSGSRTQQARGSVPRRKQTVWGCSLFYYEQ